MAKIGKNILENLTSGMYEDSKIIYREYIQNAADSIDKAIKKNLFDVKLFIDIDIRENERKIIIKDNAEGIPQSLIKKKLEDIADSDKVAGEDKGFRGIGRLGGLAYCKKLKFITTCKGENVKTIMTWDAEKLQTMLLDDNVKYNAESILNMIIEYSYEECDYEEHFFIVELDDIRKDNLQLLDIAEVRRYIQKNAPVPYSKSMFYKSKIKEYLNKTNQELSEYTIYLNGEDTKKLYTTVLYEKNGSSKKKYDEIYDIKIEEFRNEAGELLAWMWFGLSSLVKRIPSAYNEMAGLRLRQSNIQIGDENTLVHLFKDHRGNFYYIGEVHAVHKSLKPNARRDYFNESEVRNELEAMLTEYFAKLHKLYNDANDAKISYNKDIVLKEKEEAYDSKKGKFVNDSAKNKLLSEIKSAQADKEKADKKIVKLHEKAKQDEVFSVVFEHIKMDYEKKLIDKGFNDINKVKKNGKEDTGLEEISNKRNKKEKYLVDELSKLNKGQKDIVTKVYNIIQENLPEKESTSLIKKIQEEFKK